MKNIIKISALACLSLVYNEINGQVLTNGTPENQFNNNNVFFDASTNFDPDLVFDNNNGKGLLFPRTDLTQWVWLLDDMNNGGGALLPTAYDGMIVYNIGTGNTPTGGSNPTTSTAVTPGFYYFSNPSVDPNNFSPSITDGQWIRIGDGGNTVSSGAANPVNGTGNNGDFYINTTTNQIFGPYNNGSWGSGVSLVGPQGPAGATGAQGPQGPAGPQGLTGATGPQGPAGATGATGATGPQGPAGTNGKTVLNGASNPTGAQGTDGDFYINTATNTLFGPKAGGVWPSGVSLVGPTGATGATGATGPQGAQGPAGPAPAGTGIVAVNGGVLQTPAALSGDVTTSGSGLATTISNDAVTSAKILDGTIQNADLANGTGGIYKGSGSLSGNTTVTQGSNNLTFDGAGNLSKTNGTIRPAVGNNSNSGISFPLDPGGGSGDEGYLRYYVKTGEDTKLVLGTSNDLGDEIAINQAGADRMTFINGRIGVGTNSPNASAAMDITSTNQGFLPPRMTSAQRAAIASPATGLLVYQNDGTSGYYYYTGTTWVRLATSLDKTPTYRGWVNFGDVGGNSGIAGSGASNVPVTLSRSNVSSSASILYITHNLNITGNQDIQVSFSSAGGPAHNNNDLNLMLIDVTPNSFGVYAAEWQGDVQNININWQLTGY